LKSISPSWAIKSFFGASVATGKSKRLLLFVVGFCGTPSSEAPKKSNFYLDGYAIVGELPKSKSLNYCY
jgi:hypothetical protein